MDQKLKKYDQCCTSCEWRDEIKCEPGFHPPCPECGAKTERLYIGGYDVRGDDVPGGFTVENIGHEPMKFYSRSEFKRELEKRGLAQNVHHIGSRGSDKSPHTQRFI